MPLIRSNALSLLFSICLVASVLYLGRPFLMPLALAVLLAFLLAPLAARVESLGVGRGPAVAIVTVVTFTLLALVLYIVGAQAVDLAKSLPGYHDNLQQKVFGPLSKLTSAFSAYTHQVHPEATPDVATSQVADVPSSNVNLFTLARELAGPLLSPLGTAGMVAVYVIFFLFDRQSLRDRFIHLVGHGRLHLATQALDDAANRVSRYLAAQLMINVCYGVPVGIGLYFIGIPNAPLWGVLAIVLRFLPYLGIWIVAAFPMVLSFAISPGWAQPLEVVALFVGVELLTGNVLEPWLYGASTGLSASAIVISAIFWTWLWGAGGLLLATPLTVCLVVLGKHLPSLSFLHILLGKEPPIDPANRFYQRLLADDRDELEETISEYHEKGATLELFDEIVLPALQLAEHDRSTGDLTREEHRNIYANLREALSSLEDFHPPDESELHPVIIMPARTEADALAGAMLAYALRSKGISCTWFSARVLNSEIASRLADHTDAILCVSTLTATGARAAASLFKRIGESVTGAKLLGFWRGERTDMENSPAPTSVEVVTHFASAIRLIATTTSQTKRPTLPAASSLPAA